VEFQTLGPLTVQRNGQDVAVTSAKLRTVLACLLIHARRLVTTDRLIDELWGEHPPASATNTLQTYVSQLRQLLEPDRRAGAEPRLLRTVPGGYLLDVEPQSVDHVRFEDALRDGRAAVEADEPEKAAERLCDGLSLWRGPALANVEGRTAELESARLDDLRLDALELRIEADLTCGRHQEVVCELDRLVREHPWRERLTGLLMVALYRCGRQAEALARYREVRDRLVTELAIDPGPELRELERRILQQDRGLNRHATDSAAGRQDGSPQRPADPAEPTGPAPSQAAAPRDRRWRAVVFAVCGLVIVAALASVAGGLWPDRGRDRASSVATRRDGVFNEFDLAVHPGIGYDLDIPPGRPADWHSTNNPRSPDYDFLDLYRTSSQAPEAENQISGVDLRNTNEFNVIHHVADTDPPTVCGGLPRQGGGNVKMHDLHQGAKVCLHTHENRWVMITVTRMPADRAALLFVHVTVLTS
jgi:DNA-binding SARP family transcriptional activator